MSEHESGHAHDGSHDGHSHRHAASSTSTRKLAAVSAINLLGLLVGLLGGLLFGSVALLSDAVHMLFDALAYVVAFAATNVVDRATAELCPSYGDSDTNLTDHAH